MILFSLFLSGVLLALIACVLRASGGTALAAIISVLATLFGLMTVATAFAAQAALTVIVLIVCGAAGVSRWGTFRGTLIAAGVAYGLFAVSAVPELIHLQRLRTSYPITSLADRLSYERTRPTTGGPAPTDDAATTVNATPQRLRSELETELQEQERHEQQFAGYRSNSSHFRRLHTATAADFVFGIGFGSARMGYIRPSQLRLPDEPPPVPQPSLSGPGETYAVEGELPPQATVPTRYDFQQLHRTSRFDFLAPDRWGYVKDRDHTVGFAAHGFRAMPKFDNQQHGVAEWQTVRIELVSLLKQVEPRVYTSKNLPKMDELRDAPTRAADDFELSAVEKLRAEEDVVAHTATNVIHLVGSIRASEACLQCHTARRGDLLGALSYELRRVTPLPEPKPQPEGIPLTIR